MEEVGNKKREVLMMKRTKKDIARELVICTKYVYENKLVDKMKYWAEASGCEFTTWASEELLMSSFMKNKKDNLEELLYNLVENLMYNDILVPVREYQDDAKQFLVERYGEQDKDFWNEWWDNRYRQLEEEDRIAINGLNVWVKCR